MSGSVRQRSRGTWQIRYEGPPDGAGERRQLSETIKGTRKDAERVLRQRLGAIDAGGFIERDRQNLSTYLQRWLSTISTSVTLRTLYGYRGYLERYVVPTLGGIGLQSLQPQTVQGLYSGLLERLSARTVLGVHRILHKALADGVKWGLLVRNVCDAVTPPRFERHEMPLWDRDNIAAFFVAAKDSPFSDAYRVLLMTGLRRSELGGLQWGAVDLDRGSLRVVQTLQRIGTMGLVTGSPKTAKSRRTVALSPETVDLFRKIKTRQLEQRLMMGPGWQDTGYVITDIDGGPTDPTRLTKDFIRIVKRSGLPHLSLHGLRHVHASLMLMNGTHLKIVSERLGHSSIAITADVYSHLLPGLQEEAALALDNLLTETTP